MKPLFALLLMLACSGCAVKLESPITQIGKSQPAKGSRPQLVIPQSWRVHNWLGPKGEGSCVHATMTMLFYGQGKTAFAEYYRKHMGDGEWDVDLAKKLDAMGVKYAYTSEKGDVKFLEWACRTHRGCGVTVMGGKHMVLLCHLDKQWAGIIDNNYERKVKWVPRQTFISEWLNSNSWAITPTYTPQPPVSAAK